MIDLQRTERVHVVNVRMKGNAYVIILSDGSEVTWDLWCSMSEKERRKL